MKFNDLTSQWVEPSGEFPLSDIELSIFQKDNSILGNLTSATGITIEPKELILSKVVGKDWNLRCEPSADNYSYWQFASDDGCLEEINPSEFVVYLQVKHDSHFYISMDDRSNTLVL